MQIGKYVRTAYFVNCYSQLKYVRYMMENSLGIGAVCLILVTIFDIPIK